MLEHFSKFFNVSSTKKNDISNMLNDHQSHTEGFEEMFSCYNGQTFGEGLYRLHDINKIESWNKNIIKAFPEFSGRITSFGYDWIGRQFALDNQRVENGQTQVLMFEPGTGEVLEIPCNFFEFHNVEIPNYHDACLASNFFNSWKSVNKKILKNEECAGYKVMLFLGGEDVVDNLERSNMDVYWGICSAMLQKVNKVPEGMKINDVKIK